MKTIDELAKKNFEKHVKSDLDSEVGIIRDAWYKSGFKDCAEIIQRMIPFTEELPPYNERIIVKTKHNNEFHTFKFTGNSDIKSSAEYLSLVSWRPLNFK
jgi:hypothetical protein